MKIEKVSIDSIKVYPNNAKIHTAEQIEEIKKSIQEFGNNDPIAIDEKGFIIEGEGRYLAQKDMGLKEIEVIKLTHLSEEQKVAYMLVHNKLTIYEKETFKVYILNDDNDTEINKIVKRISEEKMQIMQIMNRKLYAIRIIQNKVETCVSVKTHHIISDAWTLGQIAEQIKEYYLKISNDEEIDIKPSYIEYIKYL